MWFALGAFAAMWCTICFVLSRLSGWQGLPGNYRTMHDGVDETLRFQWAQIGPVNFASCLRFDLTNRELRIRIFWPFRPFHPAPAIPWTDIYFKRSTGFLFPSVELRIGDPERGRMRIRARAWRRFQPYVEDAQATERGA